MIIFLEGRIAKKDLVELFTINVLKELNVDRRRATDLEIRFMNKIDCGALGTCSGDPGSVDIEISKGQSFFEQMCTLAHELVHAKQFIKKEYPSETEAKKLEYHLFGKCFPWDQVK